MSRRSLLLHVTAGVATSLLLLAAAGLISPSARADRIRLRPRVGCRLGHFGLRIPAGPVLGEGELPRRRPGGRSLYRRRRAGRAGGQAHPQPRL
jgi:hypothetical protein